MRFIFNYDSRIYLAPNNAGSIIRSFVFPSQVNYVVSDAYFQQFSNLSSSFLRIIYSQQQYDSTSSYQLTSLLFRTISLMLYATSQKSLQYYRVIAAVLQQIQSISSISSLYEVVKLISSLYSSTSLVNLSGNIYSITNTNFSSLSLKSVIPNSLSLNVLILETISNFSAYCECILSLQAQLDSSAEFQTISSVLSLSEANYQSYSTLYSAFLSILSASPLVNSVSSSQVEPINLSQNYILLEQQSSFDIISFILKIFSALFGSDSQLFISYQGLNYVLAELLFLSQTAFEFIYNTIMTCIASFTTENNIEFYYTTVRLFNTIYNALCQYNVIYQRISTVQIIYNIFSAILISIIASVGLTKQVVNFKKKIISVGSNSKIDVIREESNRPVSIKSSFNIKI